MFPAIDEREPRESDRYARLSPGRGSLCPLGGLWKRTLDLLVASTALILFSPVMLAVALLIFATDGRPIIYSQKRIGFGGKPFDCYKFRTMVRNSDAMLRRHLAENPEAADEWSRTQKLRKDPRITTVGHFLRKSSLDELPQLFNVVRGEMSCVGPRPVVADELRRYGAEGEQYLKARPGITGAWQVSGRSKLSYEERVALDSAYVKNWALLCDIGILIKTIPAAMRVDRTS